MDLSISPKDEIWFLCVCHHISTGLYLDAVSVSTYDCCHLNTSMQFIGYFFACTLTLVITVIPTVCGMCFCTWPVLNFTVFSLQLEMWRYSTV